MCESHWYCLQRILGRQNTFILLKSVVLALEEMKFYGRELQLWQRCLLCRGTNWSCNLDACYWADIYDYLMVQTRSILPEMRDIKVNVYASNIKHYYFKTEMNGSVWSTTQVFVTQQTTHTVFVTIIFNHAFVFLLSDMSVENRFLL